MNNRYQYTSLPVTPCHANYTPYLVRYKVFRDSPWQSSQIYSDSMERALRQFKHWLGEHYSIEIHESISSKWVIPWSETLAMYATGELDSHGAMLFSAKELPYESRHIHIPN